MSLKEQPDKENPVNTGETIKELEKHQKRTDTMMMFVIVVLFIGFIGVVVALGGIIVDSFRSREASYQDLVNKINEENSKIDFLLNQLKQNTSTPRVVK
jgi:hypothetical protein